MVRDYAKEYREYHGKKKQIKQRSSRNKARRKLKKDGRVEDGDGKEVDHKDGNPNNNSPSNLRVTSRETNRKKKSMPYTTAQSIIQKARALIALGQQENDQEVEFWALTRRVTRLIERAGARHSSRDNRMLQEIHDAAVSLGAMCPGHDND